MTLRDPIWFLGYLAATSLDFEMIAVIAIPRALDVCERMDFVDGVLVGDRDRRNAEEIDRFPVDTNFQTS